MAEKRTAEEVIGAWADEIAGRLDEREMYATTEGGTRYLIDSAWSYLCYAVQKKEKDSLEAQTAELLVQDAVRNFLCEEIRCLPHRPDKWSEWECVIREFANQNFFLGNKAHDGKWGMEDLCWELQKPSAGQVKKELEKILTEWLLREAKYGILEAGFDAETEKDFIIRDAIEKLKEMDIEPLQDLQEGLRSWGGSALLPVVHSEWTEEMRDPLELSIQSFFQSMKRYTLEEMALAFWRAEEVNWGRTAREFEREEGCIDESWFYDLFYPFFEGAIDDIDIDAIKEERYGGEDEEEDSFEEETDR